MKQWIRQVSLTALAVYCLSPTASLQATSGAPRYLIKASWGDTHLPPGGGGQFIVQARNIGIGTSEEPFTITDELPANTTITDINWSGLAGDFSSWCSGVGTSTATCSVPQGSAASVPTLAPAPGMDTGYFSAEPAGYFPTVYIDVAIDGSASGVSQNRASVVGGGSPPASDVDDVSFNSAPSGFGIVDGSLEAGLFAMEAPWEEPSHQAGDHPFEFRLNLDLNTRSRIGADRTREIRPSEPIRKAEVTLPAGLIGDPGATPRCDPPDFAQIGVVLGSTSCPSDTQIGYLNASVVPGGRDFGRAGIPLTPELMTRIPLYNLQPPPNRLGDFAANVGEVTTIHLYPELDPLRGYSTKVVIPYITSRLFEIKSIEATLWGVPADPAHDKFRYFSPSTVAGHVLGAPFGPTAVRPFLTNPVDCEGEGRGVVITAESFKGSRTPSLESPDRIDVDGCSDPRLRFEPAVALSLTSSNAGDPSGLDAKIKAAVPSGSVDKAKELYAANGFIAGVGSPPLRKAVITLPQGMFLSPSAAQGLGSCSESQIGLSTSAAESCPESSKIGSVRVDTPLLVEPLTGSVFLATPYRNPFQAAMAGYMTMEGPGVNIKLPIRLDVSPGDGQVTVSVADVPQLPLASLSLHFNAGSRAAFTVPRTCGTRFVHYEMISWAGSSPVTGRVALSVDRGCNDAGFRPTLAAGTIDPVAGANTSLVLELSRDDHEANISSLSVRLPRGLTANLGSVPTCRPLLVASGNCPQASKIGSVVLSAGPGRLPLWLPDAGKNPTAVYLAGPYKGAPFSLVLAVPAQAGPFDFGTVAVRAAVSVDPGTAAVTIRSDPLPQILEGVPIEYRTIYIHLDRPGFIRNPTNCKPTQVSGAAVAPGGATAELRNRFQVAGCAALPFRLRFALRLSSALARNGHPTLTAVVTAKPGQADIARAAFALPRTELLEYGDIRAVCGRMRYAAGGGGGKRCPSASRYGRARVFTPLLRHPLEGPLYLRSNGGQRRLPDLVASLSGESHLDLVAHMSSAHGLLREVFAGLPDIPLTRIVMQLRGGQHGLLVNTTDLCRARPRAWAGFLAHNGKARTVRPSVRISCSG